MDYSWIAPLITLTLMEVVLGIDNIIFIAIVAGKLPAKQQPTARFVGLGAAMVLRIVLLLVLMAVLSYLKAELFNLHQLGIPEDWTGGHVGFSWQSFILLAGGLFLIGKAVFEIHNKLEGKEHHAETKGSGRFIGVIAQIILLDLVFSVDSVVTAIGMVKPELFWVMIVSVVVAVFIMMIFAGPISNFVHKRPTLKMLALAFLILIGVMLVAEAFHQEIPKGYIYFAMAFALGVEFLNTKMRKATEAVHLREPVLPAPEAGTGEGKKGFMDRFGNRPGQKK